MGQKLIVGVGGAGCSLAEKTSRELQYDMLGVNYSRQTLEDKNYTHSLCLEKYNKEGQAVSIRAVESAALKACDDFKAILSSATDVIMVVGLGGQTGSAATPILIDAAKRLGVHVTSIATLPFAFETERREVAEQALAKLNAQSDELHVFDYADKAAFPQDCSLLAYFDRGADLILERGSCGLTVEQRS